MLTKMAYFSIDLTHSLKFLGVPLNFCTVELMPFVVKDWLNCAISAVIACKAVMTGSGPCIGSYPSTIFFNEISLIIFMFAF